MLRPGTVFVRFDWCRPGLAVVLRMGEPRVIGLELHLCRAIPRGHERSISQPLNGRHVRVAEKPVLAGRNDAWLGPVSARSFHEFERRSGAVRLDPTQDGAAGG